MSAYNPPSQEQSIFNPTNYSLSVKTTEDSLFDELTATTGTFTNLLIGSDNVATKINNIDTATQSNTSNLIGYSANINTNTTAISTLNSTLNPITDKNSNVPRTYSIGSSDITNLFTSSTTFAVNNTNYEFASFDFEIPTGTNSSQIFVFESINIGNYHFGNIAHNITLSYALSTDLYATKTEIRTFGFQTGYGSDLIRGTPHITIRNNVGNLGLGSGTYTFTIKLYVKTDNNSGTRFKSDYEVATLKLFD